MSRLEYIFALLECFFDILSAIALNLKVMLEKRRQFYEPPEDDDE